MSEHGVLTNELGELLDKELSGHGLTVYHDHGPKSEKVGAISAYLGDEMHRDTKLAEIDIAILDGQNRVILLVEVEESADRPKTIIGDVMATILADKIAFKGKTLNLNDDGVTLLILCMETEENHESRMSVIAEKLNRIIGNEKNIGIKIKGVKLKLYKQPEKLKREILEEIKFK